MPQAPVKNAAVKRLAKRVNWFENFIRLSCLFVQRIARFIAFPRLRRRAAFRSALTVTMHVTPPVIAAAKKNYIRRRVHDYCAAVTSADEPHTSTGQGRQHGNGEPNPDSLFTKYCQVRVYD